MREIDVKTVTAAVRQLAIDAAYQLGDDVMAAFERGLASETSPTGKDLLGQLIENAQIAAKGEYPMCQDTGLAVVFVELGQEVRLTGGDVAAAVTEGVRQGYGDGYLRKSVCHPFTRKNTGDNTPCVLHLRLVPGDRMRITLAGKGGGSENQSRVTMLKPSDGVAGIRKFVVDRVREAGPNPCPPIVVGVGIGGTFEKAALLAKESLLRPLDDVNPDP